MEIGIPVEVEGTFGEFYPGIVCGINSLEEYRVNLLDPSHSASVLEVNLPPASMRLPPDVSSFPFDPMQGQEVDVLIPCCPNTSESPVESDQEVRPISKLSAWWPGHVKKVGGSFVIVELASTFPAEVLPEMQSSHDVVVANNRISVPLPSSILKTDIVEKHQLRPRSHQSNFSNSSFHMHNIDIPDALVPYCREPANYIHFARRCGLPILMCMAPDSMRPSSPVSREDGETYEHRARLLVIATDVATVKRAAVIDNTFIDMLRQKVQILQQTEELSRKLEASRVSQIPAPFVEFLRVPEGLIPQAIGYQGSNIRKAYSVEGILSIKLDRPECTFRISGKTLEAVQEAKAMLDYATEVFPVPRCYVGPILGSGQRHIQHIVDRIGLSGMRISGPLAPDVTDFVAFHLTGTRRAIADAQMFLEFHIASLRELDELRGVKSPPMAPPMKEVTQDGDASEDTNNPAHGNPGGPGKQRKRPGRSAQHGRRRVLSQHNTDLSNGDGIVHSGDDANHDSAQDSEHPDQPNNSHANQVTASGNTRPPLNSRQRRAQHMQSNNNSASNKHDLREDNAQHKRAFDQTNDHSVAKAHGPPLVNGNAPKSSGIRHPEQQPRELNQANGTFTGAPAVGATVM